MRPELQGDAQLSDSGFYLIIYIQKQSQQLMRFYKFIIKLCSLLQGNYRLRHIPTRV